MTSKGLRPDAAGDAEPARDDTEQEMADADVANGEGPAVNDTERRYGDNESPA
jgi:hypothetical protein